MEFEEEEEEVWNDKDKESVFCFVRMEVFSRGRKELLLL